MNVHRNFICNSENLEPVYMSFNGQWLYQLWNIYILEHLLACLLSCFSHVRLFVTLWTIALQAPLSMGFSRQEYWYVKPLPPLPHPEIESGSPALQTNSLLAEPWGKPMPLVAETNELFNSSVCPACYTNSIFHVCNKVKYSVKHWLK